MQMIKMRILAIFGETKDLDLARHRRALEALANVELIMLHNPQLEDIGPHLRDIQGWSIIFFAGHSITASLLVGVTGLMQINESDIISIDNLKFGLQKATKKGLKLIIFNSCDGIGLAMRALQIGVPRCIIFKERVSNQVAAKFVENFLTAFQEQPLPLALREARQQLELFELKFPCATWLPQLFTNKEAPELTWEMLERRNPDTTPIPPPKPIKKIITFNELKSKIMKLKYRFLILVLIVPLILVIRYNLPWSKFFPQTLSACDLKPEDIWFSCGEKAIFKDNENINKQKGIEAYANDNYQEALNLFDQAWRETKHPEILIYLNNSKLKRDQITNDKIITIAVAIPLNYKDTYKKDLSEAILKGIAQKQDEFNKENHPWKLQILIANDGDNPDDRQAQKVADKLVTKDIIAVMGHYASRVTKQVKPIYRNHQIVLLSGHSGSYDLFQPGDDTFFFRVVNNTEQQAAKVIEYLQKNHQKVALFTVSREFSKSFYERFKKQWVNLTKNYKIVHETFLEKDKSINTEVEQSIKNGASAIVLCPDVKSNDKEISNTKKVIENNNNQLLIAGCNTLYHLHYNEIIDSQTNQGKKIVIAVFWIPDNNAKKVFRDFWEEDPEKVDLMRYGLSYDAMQVLTDATNKLFEKGKKLSSIELQQILTNKFETNGLTGKITLKGSERLENITGMIERYCESENVCKWRRID